MTAGPHPNRCDPGKNPIPGRRDCPARRETCRMFDGLGFSVESGGLSVGRDYSYPMHEHRLPVKMCG